MTKRFLNLLLPMLADKHYDSDEELYMHLLSTIATCFAAIMHVFLLAFFAFASVPEMVVLNLLSMLTYLFCAVFIKKRKYFWPGLIISVEVIIYSVAASVVVGGGNYVVFYLFTVLNLQFILPYATVRVRRAVVAACILGIFAVVLMDTHYVAPVLLTGNTKAVLSVFNVALGTCGAVVELSIDSVLRNVVTRYNQRQVRELTSQAHTDPLTDLYNRRYADIFFQEMVKNNGAGGKRWCVALLDIDDFKVVNDRYGHRSGDMVLAALARQMRGSLRKTDVLFRWGGEEFLILLSDVDLDTATVILEKIRQNVENTPIAVVDHIIGITVTIGACQLDIGNIQGCIDLCDRKMYEGKSKGKNQIAI